MIPATDDPDRTAMTRLATGHEAALNDLMERHGEKLFHHLIRCLQNEEDAADLAQETFVRVYQNRAKFDANQKFSTWLYAIATNLVKDRYRYRTPSLLNVELTAPYGHAGAYRDLDTVFAHYIVPNDIVAGYLANRDWCRLPQFTGNCTSTFADVSRNTQVAMAKMQAVRVGTPTDAMPVVDPIRVPPETSPQMTAFLRTLTDPCLKDRACFGRWIPNASEAPDGHQLNAIDSAGRPL